MQKIYARKLLQYAIRSSRFKSFSRISHRIILGDEVGVWIPLWYGFWFRLWWWSGRFDLLRRSPRGWLTRWRGCYWCRSFFRSGSDDRFWDGFGSRFDFWFRSSYLSISGERDCHNQSVVILLSKVSLHYLQRIVTIQNMTSTHML